MKIPTDQPTAVSRRTTPSRPMTRRGGAARIVIIVLALVALGAIGILTLRGGGPTDESTGSSIEIFTADLRSFTISTTASGELEARNQVEVRSRLDDRSSIVDIVPEGSRVMKDDILVKLNADALQNQLDEQEARVESAKAELIASEEAKEIQDSENESSLRKAELKHRLAELSLDQWAKGEHAQKDQELNFALDKAQEEVVRLQEKYDQSIELEAEGFLSKDELKRDRLALKTARNDLAKAELNRKIYDEYEFTKQGEQKRSDVEEAAAEVSRVTKLNASRLASKQADLINKRRQLSLREERLATLKGQVEAATLRAPTNGLVVYSTSMERNSWRGGSEGPWQVGSEVYPNQLIIVLPDTSEMIGAVRVHESLVGRIKKGQASSIRIDAIGGRTIEGVVEDIGVLAETGGWRDPNRREYTVRIALDDSDFANQLKPSMRCEAQITMGTVEEALAVPIQAVFSEGKVQFVYIKEGVRFARQPVNVGRKSDEFAEIVSGLAEGDRVLLREPVASEVIDREFTDEQLATVGLQRNKDGRIGRPDDGKKKSGRPKRGFSQGAPKAAPSTPPAG